MGVSVVSSIKDVITRRHRIYVARVREWRDTERRLRGGRDVLQELQPFDYAKVDSAAYRQRQNRARYINFPDDIASMIVGHVMQAESTISFGTLGEVKRAEGQTVPSFAELAFYNIDGIGNDASQWGNFWAKELRMSMGTGHRWEYVDAPATAAMNMADILAGRRPFISGMSPTKVTDWEFQHNVLLYAIVRHRSQHFAKDDPRSTRHPAYTLLVRKGFDDFGTLFAGGGWWNLNLEGDLIPGQTGTWDRTLGDIPMTPLYYQRDDGTDGDEDGEFGAFATSDGANRGADLTPAERRFPLPSMSKSGLFELGQLAVDYMNSTSAQSFDVWDAAASVMHIAGTNPDAYATAKRLQEEGSKWIVWDRDDDGNEPTFHDSSLGTVAPQAMKFVLDQIFTEVRYLANRELGISENTSGTSKQASFTREQSPKLSNMASEAENAMNACIRWLELRWPRPAGQAITVPTGAVKIGRKFDIVRIATNVAEYIALQNAAGVSSPTLTKNAMILAATELGIMGDDADASKIAGEFDTAIKQQADAQAQAQAQATDFAKASTNALESGDTKP